jgi:hypothetical protein
MENAFACVLRIEISRMNPPKSWYFCLPRPSHLRLNCLMPIELLCWAVSDCTCEALRLIDILISYPSRSCPPQFCQQLPHNKRADQNEHLLMSPDPSEVGLSPQQSHDLNRRSEKAPDLHLMTWIVTVSHD